MSGLLGWRCAAWTRAIVLSFSVVMLGFAATGMGMRHALAAPAIDAKQTAAAGMPMTPAGPCDQCGGDHDMSTATCSALCTSTLAVLPAANSPAVPAILRIAALPIVSAPTSHNDPPDPYPPRPAILS